MALKLFIYFEQGRDRGSNGGREGKRERHRGFPSADSLPKELHWPGLEQGQARSLNVILDPQLNVALI